MSVDGMPLPAWKHSRPGGTGHPADAEAWNRWYTENDRGWAPASSSVRAMLNGLAPGRALDLGAGDGRNAVWLAGRGWHVTAMDFSAAALDIGRGRAFAEGVTDLITGSVADVTTCAPARGSLDLVLAAFLHLPGPDLERVIARNAPGLAPGGLFLYIGHDPADPREGTAGTTGPVRAARQRAGCRLGQSVRAGGRISRNPVTARSRGPPARAGLRGPGPQPGRGNATPERALCQEH